MLSFALFLLGSTLSASAQHLIVHHYDMLAMTRLDPIVSPGAVSGHIHSIFGGSNFGSTYDSASYVGASCTTADVPLDKSNYWVPTLYFKYNNGSYEVIDHGVHGINAYYNNRYSTQDTYPNQVFPFPAGFTMLGGTAKDINLTDASAANPAATVQCEGGSHDKQQGTGFPSLKGWTDCTQWRVQINMPNCWDGVRATSSDNSHVSYPSDGVENGYCPKGFKRIPSIFYESFYDINPATQNLNTGTFVLSNGDVKGYSYHGDFVNGWDQDTINNLVTTCYGAANDPQQCALQKTIQTGAKPCTFQGQLADEPNGRYEPIAALPSVADTNINIVSAVTGAIISSSNSTISSSNSTMSSSNSTMSSSNSTISSSNSSSSSSSVSASVSGSNNVASNGTSATLDNISAPVSSMTSTTMATSASSMKVKISSQVLATSATTSSLTPDVAIKAIAATSASSCGQSKKRRLV